MAYLISSDKIAVTIDCNSITEIPVIGTDFPVGSNLFAAKEKSFYKLTQEGSSPKEWLFIYKIPEAT